MVQLGWVVGSRPHNPGMKDLPLVPWPFLGAEARTNRTIPDHTIRTRYKQLYPGVYVPDGAEVSAQQNATAAWLWSRRRGVVSGLSAAAMLGTKWIENDEPAELIYRNRMAPEGLIVRAESLQPGEVVRVGDMRVTSPARTAFDLGRYIVGRVAAVQHLDALVNATGVKLADVEAVMAAHPGARGLARLRTVLPLVDGGAESPQETDARLALVDAGLPAPRTQYVVYGKYGEFIARVDMAYEEVKVAIEYDGPQHWEDPFVRQRDIDKGVAFGELGWHVIRVSSDLLYHRRATYRPSSGDGASGAGPGVVSGRQSQLQVFGRFPHRGLGGEGVGGLRERSSRVKHTRFLAGFPRDVYSRGLGGEGDGASGVGASQAIRRRRPPTAGA